MRLIFPSYDNLNPNSGLFTLCPFFFSKNVLFSRNLGDDVFITVYLHQLLIVRLSYTYVFDRGSRTYFCTPTTVGGV
jgi:hypothetical protein